MEKTIVTSVDEYISDCPETIQPILEQLRATILHAVPDAKEKISYQIPTYTLTGNLVHFGAFKNHVGFYLSPAAIVKFKEELADYSSSKGTIQFPYGQPLPLELISNIVRFCVQQNVEKATGKKAI